MASQETVERLLAAAEELIAERGPHRVTVRDITSLAGMNTAAVNYHFGTKDNLLKALVARNADRFGARRNELLAQGDATTLEGVVRVLVLSTAELAADVDGDGRRWLRCKLQLRHHADTSDVVREVFWPYTVQMLKAFSAVTPDLPPKVRNLRFALARDVLDNVFAGDRYPIARGGQLGFKHDELVEHLVKVLVAAFAAPV